MRKPVQKKCFDRATDSLLRYFYKQSLIASNSIVPATLLQINHSPDCNTDKKSPG